MMRALNLTNLPTALRIFRSWASAVLVAYVFAGLSVAPGWTAETCVWRGTAPFCSGKCLGGEITRQTVDHSNDPSFGKSCTVGSKVLCCGTLSGGPATCLIAGVRRTDIAAADCSEAQTTGCIRHLLTDAAYRACLRAQPTHSTGCRIAGVLRFDIADADCHEAFTTGCIQHLLTQAQYAACLKAQPVHK